MWSPLPVFGVRVSVMLHLRFVHYTFSSVWVAEWPPFGKKLPARLIVFCLFVIFISRFGFRSRDLAFDCSSSCSLLFLLLSNF